MSGIIKFPGKGITLNELDEAFSKVGLMRVDPDKFKTRLRERDPDAYDRLYRSLPIRIQFSLYGILVAECIVPQFMVERVIARYSIAKYRKSLPCGGAVSYRADLPRIWDVPVGSPTNYGD